MIFKRAWDKHKRFIIIFIICWLLIVILGLNILIDYYSGVSDLGYIEVICKDPNTLQLYIETYNNMQELENSLIICGVSKMSNSIVYTDRINYSEVNVLPSVD